VPLLIVGEIRTGVLRNSGSLVRTQVAELLRLIPGERVWISERPVPLAVSPARFTGVDCVLATASRAQCRGVGTVSARAVVTGGRVLQGSAHAVLERGRADRRLPWAHYLASPGVVRTIGRFDERDLVAGYLADAAPTDSIDLGAVADRLMTSVQISRLLDHEIPLRARRTRLRWAATVTDDDTAAPAAEFTIVDDVIRTLRTTVPGDTVEHLSGFCENLALHDWALTTLLDIVDRSNLGSLEKMTFARLRPAIDHLLHLWMPGAHVDASLLPLWDCLEQRPGFSRQWLATVDRIRDQLAMQTLTALRSS
jgi:hypothetical protein